MDKNNYGYSISNRRGVAFVLGRARWLTTGELESSSPASVVSGEENVKQEIGRATNKAGKNVVFKLACYIQPSRSSLVD